jgi:hypothetical protein
VDSDEVCSPGGEESEGDGTLGGHLRVEGWCCEESENEKARWWYTMVVGVRVGDDT